MSKETQSAVVPAMSKEAKADPLAEAREEAVAGCREALEDGTLNPLNFDDILLGAGYDGDPIEVLNRLI